MLKRTKKKTFYFVYIYFLSLSRYIFFQFSPIHNVQEKDPLSRTNRRNIFNTFYRFLLIDFFLFHFFVCVVFFGSSLILVVLQIQYLLLSLKKKNQKKKKEYNKYSIFIGLWVYAVCALLNRYYIYLQCI